MTLCHVVDLERKLDKWSGAFWKDELDIHLIRTRYWNKVDGTIIESATEMKDCMSSITGNIIEEFSCNIWLFKSQLVIKSLLTLFLLLIYFMFLFLYNPFNSYNRLNETKSLTGSKTPFTAI